MLAGRLIAPRTTRTTQTQTFISYTSFRYFGKSSFIEPETVGKSVLRTDASPAPTNTNSQNQQKSSAKPKAKTPIGTYLS